MPARTPATTTTERSELARALAFERALQVAAGATSEPHPLGRIVRHPGHPGYRGLNELQVVGSAPPGLDAATIVAAADVAQAGLPHRRVVVDDDEAGARIARAIGEYGWEATHDIYMALRRPPDRRPSVAAYEVGLDALLAAKRPTTVAAVGARDSDIIAGGTAAIHASGRARHFVADHDGRPASYASLYADGTVAQVEAVGTEQRARGHGLARAVVQAAVDTALAEGSEFVFIVADAEDWPHLLYGRLGFDAIGYCWAFVRLSG